MNRYGKPFGRHPLFSARPDQESWVHHCGGFSVLGQGMRLAVIGTVAGLAAAYGLTRLLAKFLFGVKATDPLAFSVVAAILILVTLLACFVPTRRAMRVDPMFALRQE